MSYWLISVPTDKNEQATRDRLRHATEGHALVSDFKIPHLKVGTLDSLISLSDKLQKVDTIVEGVVKKIERSYYDVYKADPNQEKKDEKSEKSSKESPELKIDSKTPAKYVEEFKWSDRYSTRAELNFLTDKILEIASKHDDTLKKSLTEFNEMKVNLTNIDRRETGTLLVKPLGQFINGENSELIIEKEWITTLIVVVPVVKEIEFLGEYEILEKLAYEKDEAERKRKAELVKQQQEARQAKGEKKEEIKTEIVEESPLLEKKDHKSALLCNVVPGSAKKLTPDGYEGEFCLYRILVFKRGADTIKNLCREKRYTVRPFKYDPEEDKQQAQEKERLTKAIKKTWRRLIQWCQTSYSELFSAWVHLKAIRVYVESVLRFGLPVNVQSYAVEPRKGKDTKVRQVLKDLYKDLPNAGLTSELDPGETDISGFGSDFYPYVYFAIKITDGQTK